MVNDDRFVPIPNPHRREIGVNLLAEILKASRSLSGGLVFSVREKYNRIYSLMSFFLEQGAAFSTGFFRAIAWRS
jgi:hypothetical protein